MKRQHHEDWLSDDSEDEIYEMKTKINQIEVQLSHISILIDNGFYDLNKLQTRQDVIEQQISTFSICNFFPFVFRICKDLLDIFF